MPSQEFIEFFLNSQSSLIQYECIELAHPNLSKTYYLCRNCGLNGLEVKHLATDTNTVSYQRLPMKIVPRSRENNLDFGMTITIGDVGEIFSEEIRNIDNAGSYNTTPTLTYRSYRSDNLDEPMYGAFEFNVYSINFDDKGASFDCATRRLNTLRTGEFYDPTTEQYRIIQSLT